MRPCTPALEFSLDGGLPFRFGLFFCLCLARSFECLPLHLSSGFWFLFMS